MSRRQTGTIATRSLPATFARALDVLRADVVPTSIAIAYSGGLDSSALLRLAHAYAREHGIALHAFHVHHGISENADAWLAHCEQACAALGVHFNARRVTLAKTKSGVEAAARKLRYAALGDMAREHGVRLMLTAHHLDDQAETVLLQLLRGAGPKGLAAMPERATVGGVTQPSDRDWYGWREELNAEAMVPRRLAVPPNTTTMKLSTI